MTIATSSIPTAEVTPEDLLLLENASAFELVDGQLVERHTGMESSEIAARIIFLLLKYLREHRFGRVFGSDASYQCFADSPRKIRRPDVSIIRFDRLPGDRTPQGHCRIAPDLAVEVISPGDLAYEIEQKVAEYLAAGVPLVWVVYPPTRTVRIHRTRSSARGPIAELSLEDSISGEEVLPGFTAAVREFFET